MSSIIKVDQIQLSDGSTPTAGDLGINLGGKTLVNYYRQRYTSGEVNEIVSYGGHGAVKPMHYITVTPQSTDSVFIVKYMYPYRCNSTRPGVKMLYIQDGTSTGTFGGSSTINSSASSNVNWFYEQHRVPVDGTKHVTVQGDFIVTPNTTSTINMGVGCQIYDENTGAQIYFGGSSNDVAAWLQILEYV